MTLRHRRRARDFYREAQLLAPLVSVSWPDVNDKATWEVEYAPEATALQKADVEALLENFDLEITFTKDARKELFQADTDWQLVNAKIKKRTPDEIVTWVNGLVNDPPTARLLAMILKQLALRS